MAVIIIPHPLEVLQYYCYVIITYTKSRVNVDEIIFLNYRISQTIGCTFKKILWLSLWLRCDVYIKIFKKLFSHWQPLVGTGATYSPVSMFNLYYFDKPMLPPLFCHLFLHFPSSVMMLATLWIQTLSHWNQHSTRPKHTQTCQCASWHYTEETSPGGWVVWHSTAIVTERLTVHFGIF